MAEVVVPDPSSSNSFPCGGVAPLSSTTFPIGRDSAKVQVDAAMKRKTPSELRGEQLKRRNYGRPSESLYHSLGSSGISGNIGELKKAESLKTRKYIDTRVDEVFPVKKSSDMFRILYGREKAKQDTSSEQANNMESPSVVCHMSANSRCQPLCGNGEASNNPDASTAFSKVNQQQVLRKLEKCSQNTFRSVAELSLAKEMPCDPAKIDMDKALKAVACELPAFSRFPADKGGKFGDLPPISSGNFFPEVHIPGHKIPLDFTLKTTMRLVSSSSVSWCHRLSTNSALTAMTQFSSQFGRARDQNVGNSLGLTPTPEVLYSNALHSWVYPQSTLPVSIINAMTISSAHGETDFLLKRQLAWMDSFQSLYYMLRKNICDIFYFCTSQFVVMFIGGNLSEKLKRSCNAYLSRSSRGLRSLLREHCIHFSMPLCHSEVEEATAEDLVELSEIEKHNLGQARHLDSMSDVDNKSQSLLVITGNEDVHRLYDFLLNYRSFLSSLTGTDVPVLYSPTPFQNASLHVPEVRCKEVKKAKANLYPSDGSHIEDGAGLQGSLSDVCYSIEVKDEILLPWTVSGICAAMGSDGRSYEASFVMEPMSSGLNVALDALSLDSIPLPECGKTSRECGSTLGIHEAVIAPCLRSSSLRSLKYSDDSFIASLSPI